MRAIFCEELGGPERLVLREVPSPSPAPGEVKVALHARGVSFVDVLMIAGQYQVKRELPFIPGSEAAGVVLETGPGAEGTPLTPPCVTSTPSAPFITLSSGAVESSNVSR